MDNNSADLGHGGQEEMPQEQHDACISIMNYLEKDELKYALFRGPAVSALAPAEAEEYQSLISEPRDLAMIKAKLINNEYPTFEDFRSDVELCFTNCKVFCRGRYPALVDVASNYNKIFRNQVEKAMNRLRLNSNLAATSSSSASAAATSSSDNIISARPTRESAIEATNAIKMSISAHDTSAGNARRRAGIKDATVSPSISEFTSQCDRIVKDISSSSSLARLLNTPVDAKLLQDYPLRIPHAIDYATIRQKLNNRSVEGNKYAYLEDFALDMRRIIGNFIRYNYFVADIQLRKEGVKLLFKFETLWKDFAEGKGIKLKQPLPELKQCLEAIEDMLKTRSSTAAHQSSSSSDLPYAIEGFINPFNYYVGEDDRRRYAALIERPVDVGSIISRICEADYESVHNVLSDFKEMALNCEKYWKKYGGEFEKLIIKDAFALEAAYRKALTSSLPSLASKTSQPSTDASQGSSTKLVLKVNGAASSTSSTIRVTAMPPPLPPLQQQQHNHHHQQQQHQQQQQQMTKPSSAAKLPAKEFLYSVPHNWPKSVEKENPLYLAKRAEKYLGDLFRFALSEIKKHYYYVNTPKGELKVFSAAPFLKAVDPNLFPDYHAVISSPMDIARMEKKLSAGKYSSLPAILFDMELIRENCYIYNQGDSNAEVRAMVDSTCNFFRFIVKTCLEELRDSADARLAALILDDPENRDYFKTLLGEPTPQSLTAYFDRLMVDTEKAAAAAAAAAAVARSKALARSSSSSSVVGFDQWQVAESEAYGGMGQQNDSGDDDDDEGDDGDGNGDAFAVDRRMIGAKKKISKKKSFGAGSGSGLTGSGRSRPKSGHGEALYDGAEANHDFDADADADAAASNRVISDWELACEAVLAGMDRHPYVDFSSVAVVGNFHVPVIEAFPDLAEDYLKVVKEPMDLTTLRNMLYDGSIANADDFYAKVASIFQNAVDYSIASRDSGRDKLDPMMEISIQYRNMRFEHLLRYVKWLSLELLPIEGDQERINGNSSSSSSGDQSQQQQQEQLQESSSSSLLSSSSSSQKSWLRSHRLQERSDARREREEMLSPLHFNRFSAAESSSLVTECGKLLKHLVKTKNKAERRQLDCFVLPIDESLLVDYFVYVRKPMDLSTVKFKLDGTLPNLAIGSGTTGTASSANARNAAILSRIKQQEPFATFSDFLGDLRRVFDNAERYNAQHRESDVVSAQVYDAAIHFQRKLQSLLSEFTMRVCDKIERKKLLREEESQRESLRIRQFSELEKNMMQFAAQEKEKLIKSDEFFAADVDAESRKTATKQQQMLHYIRKQLEKASSMLRSLNIDPLSIASDRFDGENPFIALDDPPEGVLSSSGLLSTTTAANANAAASSTTATASATAAALSWARGVLEGDEVAAVLGELSAKVGCDAAAEPEAISLAAHLRCCASVAMERQRDEQRRRLAVADRERLPLKFVEVAEAKRRLRDIAWSRCQLSSQRSKRLKATAKEEHGGDHIDAAADDDANGGKVATAAVIAACHEDDEAPKWLDVEISLQSQQSLTHSSFRLSFASAKRSIRRNSNALHFFV